MWLSFLPLRFKPLRKRKQILMNARIIEIPGELYQNFDSLVDKYQLLPARTKPSYKVKHMFSHKQRACTSLLFRRIVGPINAKHLAVILVFILSKIGKRLKPYIYRLIAHCLSMIEATKFLTCKCPRHTEPLIKNLSMAAYAFRAAIPGLSRISSESISQTHALDDSALNTNLRSCIYLDVRAKALRNKGMEIMRPIAQLIESDLRATALFQTIPILRSRPNLRYTTQHKQSVEHCKSMKAALCRFIERHSCE